ncbi:MAG TPA: protease modulator HflC [Xanthobacteraceae bacterium]|jgi:membrane protease subunit HflC|nr:protease modulator HflC [Xanthobacteraceae bacterium]
MRLGFAGGVVIVLAVIALIIGYSSLFTVYQTRQALVVRLGNPLRVEANPGLHLKWPLIDSIIYVDKRILDLENSAQEILASDSKPLIVDAFARYRVIEPLKFYQTVGTTDNANGRLSPLLSSAVRRVLGDATLIQVVRDQREDLMAKVREQMGTEAKQFGIEVVDVRIRRADLPPQNSEAVYKRMQTDREREAQEFKSTGMQKAQEIRAKADRDATVIVAEANSKGEQTRGEGDAERNRIFAEAYSKDPDFFAFYRSMQAYETGLPESDTRLVLRPDSEFFRYFTDPKGKVTSGQGTAPAANPPAPAAPSAQR